MCIYRDCAVGHRLPSTNNVARCIVIRRRRLACLAGLACYASGTRGHPCAPLPQTAGKESERECLCRTDPRYICSIYTSFHLIVSDRVCLVDRFGGAFFLPASRALAQLSEVHTYTCKRLPPSPTAPLSFRRSLPLLQGLADSGCRLRRRG